MPARGTTSSAARNPWFITVLLVMVILAVMAGIVLSRQRGTDPATALGANPAPSTEAPASAETPPVGTQTVPTRKIRKTAAATAPTATAPAGPVLVYFRVATKPSCPSGTDQVQYEGQPVVLEWKVTGADKTTLSVDGPGIYNEYGTEDSATLAFPCSGDPGSYQRHTYTIRGIGPDGTTSRTLTVRAKVNEIATT